MAKTNTEKYRFQVELSRQAEQHLSMLEQLIGVSSRKELFTIAFSLLAWAVKQRREGRVIVSVDPSTHHQRELSNPYLEQVSVSVQ